MKVKKEFLPFFYAKKIDNVTIGGTIYERKWSRDSIWAPQARTIKKRKRERCPLIFVPVAPLEYHGPHLPLGMDPINATICALETCKRIGKGVVYPTIHCGTERERPSWMLESLGFKPIEWIVGMDFPTALWKSHYSKEHIFYSDFSEWPSIIDWSWL